MDTLEAQCLLDLFLVYLELEVSKYSVMSVSSSPHSTMPSANIIDNNRLDHTDFMIDGERISEVEEFVYLGSKITKECICRTEVEDV